MSLNARKCLPLFLLSLALTGYGADLTKTAPAAKASSLAEKIILTPQSGAAKEDVEIQRWQDKARAADPRADSFERLAWAYVAKARRTLDVGYYKLAEQTADAMDARFGVSLESRLVRGHVLHNLHRFPEAEKIARALAAERGSPNDFALLSDALMEQGKLTEAVEALQRMVNLKPGVEAFGRIAHVRWLKGDLPGAISAMEQALSASNPRDSETYAWTLVRLSGYYLQSGPISRAQLLADAALKTVPGYPPALLARGRALLAENQVADGVTALRSAAAANPLPEYQWWLADALRLNGDEAGALKVEKELKERGAVSDPRTFALFLATRKASPEEAVTLAREEIANRADVLTQDALAWALAAAGDNLAAQKTITAALAEKTQDARLFLHAGEIAQLQGEKSVAQGFFLKAQPFAATLTPSERARLATDLASVAVAQTP